MDINAVEDGRIHDGKMDTSSKIIGKVLDYSEHWCRDIIRIDLKEIGRMHNVWAGVLNYVKKFSNRGAEFSKVVILKVADI